MADKTTLKVNADTKQAEKAFRSLSSQIDDLATTAKGVAVKSGVVFAGLVSGIALAGNEFGKFEKNMKGVKTLLDKTSFENVGKDLDAGFKDLTKNTLQVFKEIPIELEAATKSMFDLVSAGVPASEATKTLGVAGKLAVAGLTDVSTATDGLTSVMNAYGVAADDANKVAGKFFLAQKAGKTTISELSSGFGKVGATAQALGVSFEEVLSAVSAMTLGGVATSEAYTSLNAVLAGIAKPTSEAVTEAERLGIEFNLAALQSKGLSGFLETLTSNANFNSESVTKLFGSVEAMKTLFALTGKQAESFSSILKNLGDDVLAVDTLTAAYNETLESQEADLQLTKNAFKAMSVELGARFSPVIKGISRAIRGLIGWFSGLSDETKDFIAVGGLITTAIAGIAAGFATFLAVLPAIIAGFAAIAPVIAGVATAMAPVIGIVAGAGLVIYGLYDVWKKNFLSIQEVTFGVFAAIKTFLLNFVDTLTKTFGGVGTLLVGVFTFDIDKIKEGFNQAKNALVEHYSEVGKEYQKAADERRDILLKEKEDELNAQRETDKEITEIAKKEAVKRQKEIEELTASASKGGLSEKEKKEYQERLQAAKKAQEEINKKEQAKQEKQAAAANLGLGFAQNALQGRSGAKSALGTVSGLAADAFLPGIGGAVGGLVQTLSELGPDGAKNMIKEFATSIPDLVVIAIEALTAAIPEIITSLIDVLLIEGGLERIFVAILQSIPRIAFATVQALVLGINRALSAIANRFGIETTLAMTESIQGFLEKLKEGFNKIFEGLQKAFEIYITPYRKIFDTAKDFLENFKFPKIRVPSWLQDFIDAVYRLTSFDMNTNIGGGSGLISGTGTFLDAFAKGGIVPQRTVYAATGFTPKGTDIVPAMLTPGERVFSTSDNSKLIDSINAMKEMVGSQTIKLVFQGDGIQELIEKTLVSASSIGTGRIQVAVGSEA